MQPASLTIAVLMDSMDWFSPAGPEAREQVRAVSRALKVGGRVLVRSAGVRPWYVRVFEGEGFVGKRVGSREVRQGEVGVCVDRVNMYASTWVCTKVREVIE